jgi:prepilin-type N-terminal cleavage/methylation domain-containing protein
MRTVWSMNMLRKPKAKGFTIIELLVVISIIAVLAAIINTTVNGTRDAANTAKSKIKLKQISEWMQLWSGNNDDRVLPSQFDFTDEAAAGSAIAVRNNPGLNFYSGDDDDNPNDSLNRGQYVGTWADILWTENNLAQAFGAMRLLDFDQTKINAAYGSDISPIGLWETDSPDIYPTEPIIFEVYEDFEHPFRSMFENTRGPAKGLPGFFAANDFFDARSNIDRDPFGEATSQVDWYYTNSMINAPSRSVYLVDSVAGETISTVNEDGTYDPSAWSRDPNFDASNDLQILNIQDDEDGEVDFRYGDNTMLLMLDGSIKSEKSWTELGPPDPPPTGVDQSLFGRGIRVDNLDRR